MNVRNFVVAGVAAVMLAGGLGVARAQPRAARPARKNPKLEPGDITKKRKKARATRGNLFVLEDIKIEGKVYKPQAFHVINRKELNLEWDVRDPRFKKSFLGSLVGAVRKSPF